MEKNIVEVVTNNKGEVVEKVADYIGVASFAKTIENLYRECLEKFDNAEDMEEYIADCCEKNIQNLAWDFTLEANREMKKYLHLDDQHMVILPICQLTTLSTEQVLFGYLSMTDLLRSILTCILRW